MKLTQKIRIFPTISQTHLLWIISEKCHLLYNFALQERNHDWLVQQGSPKTNRKYINYYQQQNDLPSLKRKFPDYQWVHAKVLQVTLKK